MSTTSQRIQEGMSLRGYRQIDLVEKTGISKGALSSYISGRYVPKQNNIYLIAEALGVNEAWLMGADVPMDRDGGKRASSSALPYTQCRTKDENDLILSYRNLNNKNKRKCIAYSSALLAKQQLDDEVCEVAAAHDRTDIEITPEGRKHDLDLMNDDSFWE